MSRSLDLAARPFTNRRPVVRLAFVLWLAGGLLLAGNLWLYWDFLAGRGDVHARREQVEEAIRAEERRIAALSAELDAFDLAAQNRQVAYLNQRIDQRRFSWSRLFDELAELLPRDVRIQSLTPATGQETGRSAARAAPRRGEAEGEVLLQIQAEARTDTAILELVDALFADPDFERPNLIQQAAGDRGPIRFSLEAIYAPAHLAAEAAGAEPLLRDEAAPLAGAEEDGGGGGEETPAEPGRGPAPSAPSAPRAPLAAPVELTRPASAAPELS